MTVLVSVPTFGVGTELLEKSVRSVLAQTHQDIVCVVVGDGEHPPLPRITDSRLVVYSYPTNRGAYFAQMVALGANPHEWYAPVASDDWVEPDHIERLASHGTDMATGAVWYHSGNKKPKILRKLYEVGMYRTERMLSVGGYNPAERLGQDSLTIKVMRLVAPLGATTEPTYHRVNRAGSLCTDPATKKGSPAREAMRKRNREIVARCEALKDAEAIRLYRWSLVPEKIGYELMEHNERLRALLS
jgi:glycosyltransferase involved in cell wall biosynthesis